VSGIILGAMMVILSPPLFISLGAPSLFIAAAGALIATVSNVAYQRLDIVLSPHHPMSNHTFKPQSFGAGKLYYQGNIPILELQSDNSQAAGFTHGYLMGQYLHRLLQRFDIVKEFAASHFIDPIKVPQTLKEIQATLLPEHLNELKALVAGAQKWADENSTIPTKKITLEDVLAFHLIPDSLHFNATRTERHLAHLPALAEENQDAILGCTVVVDFDQEEGITFGRNMDWPSFGVFGAYSLIINRKYGKEKLSTVEIGFPGLIGTLTGMNRQGMVLAMNVCSGSTQEIKGMPAVFFNRHCLESCQTIDEVGLKVHQAPPLGSYHLSVADSSSAKAFHIYQGTSENPHVMRQLEKAKPLVVTNCNYDLEGGENGNIHCSQERHQIIKRLFKKARSFMPTIAARTLVEKSLTLPYVNNILTSHTTVMNPQSRKIKLAFDNAFAAKNALQELSTRDLF
jgi:hypothetical protein